VVIEMIQIKIDEEKCIRPPECTKCLQLCPERVLLNYPRERRAPGKKAGDWVVVPVHMTLCTGCKICEDVCPEKAIMVNTAV
jgi:Pyruvate/2-oxoacid:ferredoxin oxidoreductase delta subunit